MALAFGGIVFSVFYEKGNLLAYLNPSAAAIVFGGTLGAAFISFPMSRVALLPKLLGKAFGRLALKGSELVNLFVLLAERARREGLLSLEEEAGKIDDPFLKKGVLLVVDGTDPEVVRTILEAEIAAMGERHEHGFSLFEAMGGYAPTMGIIGTVLGLVTVLSHMEDPEKLAESIAVAFIATLYGVASANIIWLPIGAKLKAKSKEEIFLRELMMEGVLAVQAGDNPRIVRDKLEAFLAPNERGEEGKKKEEEQAKAAKDNPGLAARTSPQGS